VRFKFADLAVKCLIKLTKSLQTSLSVRARFHSLCMQLPWPVAWPCGHKCHALDA